MRLQVPGAGQTNLTRVGGGASAPATGGHRMGSESIKLFLQGFETAFREKDPNVDAKEWEARRAEQVRRMFEALGAGDLSAFFALIHPEIEMEIHAPGMFPWQLQARGLDSFRDMLLTNFGSLAEENPTVVSVVAQGDLVVVLGRARGVLKQGLIPYDTRFCYELTFEGDLIRKIRELVVPTCDG